LQTLGRIDRAGEESRFPEWAAFAAALPLAPCQASGDGEIGLLRGAARARGAAPSPAPACPARRPRAGRRL